MSEQFSRTKLLIGDQGIRALERARVLIFGLGGVGGSAAEALARAGIGTLGLCDGDTVSVSNINRQILATRQTVGMYKTDAAQARINDINPAAAVHLYRFFYTAETADKIDLSQYDYIIDAIDSVPSKTELIVNAQKASVPLASSMGTGNKLNPALFELSDIYQTSVCPLAKVMRGELKKRGIEKLTVVYSKEPPLKPEPGAVSPAQSATPPDDPAGPDAAGTRLVGNKNPPGSISFVPPAAGFILASKVVRDLLEK